MSSYMFLAPCRITKAQCPTWHFLLLFLQLMAWITNILSLGPPFHCICVKQLFALRELHSYSYELRSTVFQSLSVCLWGIYEECEEYAKHANPPNQTYQTKPTKPNLPNQTYQTKPTKPSLPNQTKPTKPNIPNVTYQTKPIELTWIRFYWFQ